MDAVLVFDGDCGFCTATAAFATRWIRPRAQIVAWQQLDLAAYSLTREQCIDAIQWVDGGKVVSGPAAAGAALRTARWYWRPIGWLLWPRLIQRVAWPIYNLIARNRYRLPGGTPTCALPPR